MFSLSNQLFVPYLMSRLCNEFIKFCSFNNVQCLLFMYNYILFFFDVFRIAANDCINHSKNITLFFAEIFLVPLEC